MPFDGMFLKKTTEELAGRLVGARADKIYQPSADVLVFFLRTKTGNEKLLINCSASPRLYLTEETPENPAVPPRFCMLLRKYLGGAKLAALQTAGLERLCTLSFDTRTELGDEIRIDLILELIAGNANAILAGPDGRIFDALRHSDVERSERLVLPGATYRPPTAQDKIDLSDDPAGLADAVLATPDELWHAILNKTAGCSPATARELAADLVADPTARTETLSGKRDALVGVFAAFAERMNKPPVPTLLQKDGKPTDFFWYAPSHTAGDTVKCPSLSALTDAFFREKQRREQDSARSAALAKRLNTLRARLVRKIEARKRDRIAAAEAEKYRVWGELLKANLPAVPRGVPFVDLPNYYTETLETERIKLDPALSPADNAGRYFKEYKKKMAARGMLDGLIAESEAELEYIDSVIEALARCDTATTLSEIRAELLAAGYLRENGGGKKAVKVSAPLKFTAPSGTTVLVGRNNLQNDTLTLHTADKTDLWFHTKAIHGSHTVLRCGSAEPTEADLLFAATLAAYYSKARQSSQVAVDYTRIKYVKKPSGARPGMVIYTNQQTVYVTPQEPEK